jgi:hypothetical protein
MIYYANNHKMHHWTGLELQQWLNEDNDGTGIWGHCYVAQ